MSADLPTSPGVEPLIAVGRVTVVPAAVRWQYARGSGPGGQNVNKVNTKAELWVAVSAITGLTERAAGRLRQIAGKRLTADDFVHIASDEHRSQEGNREAVVGRLRDLIVEAMHEPKVRKKTKPSRAAKRRRVEAKRNRGDVKARRQGRVQEG
ncbi:MAG TPA: alternative ribosome rescue aminoacyl-tRNA hydrolase ArfB [Tepidisphaeraceae bacterium]|jgi:ribosome-associated protein|nr:alternative ribosome rescue aminoacyl-tRNA hydrolase ArfB [Tepidisphaeraceae bacterium]